ncbi:MAG: hypothetical protein IPL84_09690 [Chitinophagaceae bacterium]|nr:hypothetical protein [Chitinophagaceae bacterium]
MQQIILLHGAIGGMDQLAELENRLAADFVVHRLNFSGHGGAPFTEPNFSIPLFAKEVIRFLDEKKLSRFLFLDTAWVDMLPCTWPIITRFGYIK